MPFPAKDETRKEWLSRCMGDAEQRKSFPEEKQRYAVCISKWNKREVKSMKEKINFSQVSVVNLNQIKFDKDENSLKRVAIMSNIAKDMNNNIIRRFTDEAMNDAVRVFQGCIARIDHNYEAGSDGRGVSTGFGVFQNTRLESDKVYGDLQLWDCEDARKVASIAQRTPTAVGFSIHTAGILSENNEKDEDDIQVICGLLPRDTDGNLASIDLVDDPASTVSLFESKQKSVANKENEVMDWSKVTIDALRANRHDIYQSILEAGIKSKSKEIAKLEQERDKAVKKADEVSVKLSAIEQKRSMEELLSEAELPDFAVTDAFKEQLLNVSQKKKDDKVITVVDQMKALIDDRKNLVDANTGDGVTGNHSKTVSQSKKGDVKVEDVQETFGVNQEGILTL